MAKYKGRGDLVEPWEQVFLETYVREGGKILSAKAAGTTWPKVKAHIEANERFAALWEAAHEEMLETLERKLMSLSNGAKGNFLAIIARLKAEMPHKYQEKAQVQAVAHLHLNAGTPTPDVVNALLREMLGDARPETRAAIAAPVEIIEAEK